MDIYSCPYGVKKKKKKVLREGVHHRNYEQRFLFFFSSKTAFRERTLIGLDVRSINAAFKMSEVIQNNEIKSDTISDQEKSIKSKQCNKFSIENILGLNDNAKVNRLELMDLCQKGKVDLFPFHPFLYDES